MTGIKPSSHGIVVEHKESGTFFAISDHNYNEKLHRKVRDLRPGETVLGYQPKRRSEDALDARSPRSATGTREQGASAADGGSEAVDGTRKATQTEGSAPAASREKEGK